LETQASVIDLYIADDRTSERGFETRTLLMKTWRKEKPQRKLPTKTRMKWLTLRFVTRDLEPPIGNL